MTRHRKFCYRSWTGNCVYGNEWHKQSRNLGPWLFSEQMTASDGLIFSQGYEESWYFSDWDRRSNFAKPNTQEAA